MQPTLYFMHEAVMEPAPVIRFVPVERCEHGNIHRHWNPVQPDGKPYWNSTGTWCPGSPTLAGGDDE